MPLIEPHVDDLDNSVSPPSPRSALFFDGTNWRVPRVDTHGRVQVRGEDQLFTFKESLASTRTAAISGADGFIDSVGPVAGLVWKVTNVRSINKTSPTTRHHYYMMEGGVHFGLNEVVAALAAGDPAFYNGEVWLEPGQTVRVYFTGGLVADQCQVDLTGCTMTKET